MSVKIIPQSVINAKAIFNETVNSNKEMNNTKFFYKPEDIDWMSKLWVQNYDKIKENPTNYFMVLTLLNRNTKSGRFALIYNDLVRSSVERRKDKEFVKLLLNPEFPEIFDNKHLTVEEKTYLELSLKKEMLSLNLLLKKIENCKKFELIPSNLYNECYIQVTLIQDKDSDMDILKHASFENSNFTMLSEYNDNTDTYHTYSFDILELLLLILMKENNMYTNKPFSESNIDNITSKYTTELKMLRRAYGK